MVSFNNFKVFPKCFCTLFQTGLLFRVQLYLSQVCNTVLPRIQRTIRNTSSFITYKPLIMVETGCTLQRLFKMFCVKLATDRPMAQEVLLFILKSHRHWQLLLCGCFPTAQDLYQFLYLRSESSKGHQQCSLHTETLEPTCFPGIHP